MIRKMIGVLICLLFLLSCTKDDNIEKSKNYNSFVIAMEKENDKELDLNFSSKKSLTNLPLRVGFELIKFKGYYWFLGGQAPKRIKHHTYFNDIWKSKDGLKWEKVKNTSEWEARAFFNLFEFDNKLWIIGGKNQSDTNLWLNDVWCSQDGVNWKLVTFHGPWENRLSMSASVFNNKIYVIGGQSETNWYVYQDIWESENGETWNKVGQISDELLGTTQTRQGIFEHVVVTLNKKNYLLGGSISSTFTQLKRVLVSDSMLDWEVKSDKVPWAEYKYTNIPDIRPFVYYGNIICIVNTGVTKIGNTGISSQDYIADKQLLYASKDGKQWDLKFELSKIDNYFMYKPRGLIINNKIYLYGTSMSIQDNENTGLHIIELTNN